MKSKPHIHKTLYIYKAITSKIIILRTLLFIVLWGASTHKALSTPKGTEKINTLHETQRDSEEEIDLDTIIAEDDDLLADPILRIIPKKFPQEEGENTSTIVEIDNTETTEETKSSKDIKDDINRAIEKTQASLGESMTEMPVTGSHIKRMRNNISPPIITIDRPSMEKTGYNSIADVLRDMTFSSFGSMRETSGTKTPGASHVNLRGLGAHRTLVLMNGKRIQKDALTQSTDLHLIPLESVERIEILKDSASAIYGSDALGGVVNIITRTNVNGSEVSFKQLISEETGGNQTEASITSGYSNSKLSITGLIHHRTNQAIYARHRNHAKVNLSSIGSSPSFRILNSKKQPYRNTNGSVAVRSRLQTTPDCPIERVFKSSNGDIICQYNKADDMNMRPKISQNSATLSANFQANQEFNTFIRLNGSQRHTKWVSSPSPADSEEGLTIPGIRAKVYLRKAQGLNKAFDRLKDTDFVDIHYRLMELGLRTSEVDTQHYNALTGATFDMGDNWEFEISASYSQSLRRDVGISGYTRSNDLKELLKNGFNPLAPKGQRGNLKNLNYPTWSTSKSNLTSTEILATGKIFEMKPGSVELAIGTQAHNEVFHIDADEASKRGEVIGRAEHKLTGKRDVVSAYVELVTPITSHIEWSLAGRQDSYSDFGQAFSPKTSLYWKLSPYVLLRSSLEKGFKAPNMNDLYRTSSQSQPFFIDQVLCQQEGGVACRPQQWLVEIQGNPNLKAEKSFSAYLGTTIQPLTNMSLSLDGWYMELKNQVDIDYETITAAESQLGRPHLRENFGIDITRDEASGTIQLIKSPIQNLAESTASGIDFTTEFSTYTGLGRWLLSIQHSHILYMKTTGLPGFTTKDKLRTAKHPPWRNTISLTYAPTYRQSGSIVARTIASHKKAYALMGNIKNYTELDLQYSYNGSWGGVISLGVRNILGTTPTIDDSNPVAPEIAHSLYDGNGRMGWVQYKHIF